jgi:uncharacterized protein involved in exopolysaccharide biosynthesis
MMPAQPVPEKIELKFEEVILLLKHHWRTIVVSVVACLAIAAGYLVVTPPMYTATTLLLIDARSNVLPIQQVRPTDANTESAHVETQVELLRSERISRAVIVTENLMLLPEFSRSRGLFGFSPPVAAASTDMQGSNEAENAVTAAAVKLFHSRLAVKRIAATHIIDISFNHSDPKIAARIANAVATAYLNEQLTQRDEFIRTTSQWLRQRSLDLLSEAHAAETALIKFRSSNAAGDASSRIVLRDLETTAQTYRWFSESFQKRFLEASQGATFNIVDARVVSPAWPPSEKSHPKKTLTLAVALAVGLAIGFLIALVLGRREEAA